MSNEFLTMKPLPYAGVLAPHFNIKKKRVMPLHFKISKIKIKFVHKQMNSFL